MRPNRFSDLETAARIHGFCSGRADIHSTWAGLRPSRAVLQRPPSYARPARATTLQGLLPGLFPQEFRRSRNKAVVHEWAVPHESVFCVPSAGLCLHAIRLLYSTITTLFATVFRCHQSWTASLILPRRCPVDWSYVLIVTSGSAQWADTIVFSLFPSCPI